MTWTDIFWKAKKVVVKTAVSAGVNALNAAGSLACTAGGAAFALSYAMDETVQASYYGSGNISGGVDVNIYIPKYTYYVNDTIPFNEYLEHNAGLTYNLEDYITPTTVRGVSALLAVSGTLARAFGANLKAVLQGIEDREYMNERFCLNSKAAATPTELYNATFESVLGSLSYTLLGCSITDMVLSYSGFLGSAFNISYPSKGEGQIDSVHYKGPVSHALFPVKYSLEHNVTVDLPLVNKVVLEEQVNASALINGTYGGGLFFQSNSTNVIPSASLGVLGIGTGLFSTFFSGRKEQLRADRNILANQSTYTAIS